MLATLSLTFRPGESTVVVKAATRDGWVSPPGWSKAMDGAQQAAGVAEHGDPRYFVIIDGVEHIWHQATITAAQIASLGGFDPAMGIIEIDSENRERTLAPNETVELKSGHGFAKKHKFRRG